MRRNALLPLLILLAALTGAVATGQAAASGLEDRERDAVVLTGDSIPGLAGIAPDSLVAFRHAGSGWRQIPVQVDERHDLNLRTLYTSSPPGGQDAVWTNAYSDPGTLSGADPNPMIDADDEIALMAVDAGPKAPASYGSVPDGMESDRATEVRVGDPLGGAGFVYLFEAKDPGDQTAGQDYVDYDFNLLAGDYLSNYDFANGPNPEASSVETDYYSTGHSDRWIDDELRLRTAGSTGVDIIDREKAQFGPGICGRSTDTFSNGEGSFIANRDGPVRAIRSYIGANSGPYTQRESVFYERHQETRTFLRVHSVRGIMQFTDYSPEATGMTYRNASNPGGVTIDGQPDSPVPGLPAGTLDGRPFWEQVSGPQGSLDVITRLETDIEGLGVTSYYLDDATPEAAGEVQCTGDSAAYGTSGSWINTGIANTDPRRDVFGTLSVRKSVFYEAPEASVARAEDRRSGVEKPLVAVASPLGRPVGRARLVAKLKKSPIDVRSGRRAGIRVKIRNAGQSRSGRIKVCARVKGRGLRLAGKRRCRRASGLVAGKRTALQFRIKARRNAKKGRRTKAILTVREGGRRMATLKPRIRLR